jgi:hypothetical protein
VLAEQVKALARARETWGVLVKGPLAKVAPTP